MTVGTGETAKVTVEAQGDGLTYQWYYTSNGSSSQFFKSSNKTATYTTTMDASRDGRRVYCVITDQYGNTVTTDTVTLRMESRTELKILTQPTDMTVGTGETAKVTVEAQGDGLTYQWYYTSNGSSTQFFKSSNKTATYTTTMDASRDGRRVYCVITDKYGNSVTTNIVILKMK
jgi:D-alanyl-D-alanine carboxypeptidase